MADFFINPDTGTGIGNGSTSDPFKDYGEVSLPLSINDTVNWKRGTTHSYAARINAYGADDLTLGAYNNSDGTDDDSLAKPILVESSGDTTFDIPNTIVRIGQTIRNLDLRDATTASQRNLNIATTDFSIDSGILIEDVDMSNAALQNLRLLGSGVTVRGCVLFDSDDDNIFTEGDNNIFENLTLSNPGRVSSGDNIQLAQTTHSPSINCIIRNNDMNAEGSIKQNIIIGGNNHLIEGNTCVAGKVSINTSIGSNNVIRKNKITATLTTYRTITNTSDDTEISCNLIIQTNGLSTSEGAIFTDNATNPKIYNNTVIGRSDTNCLTSQSLAINTVVKNSIFVNGISGIAYSSVSGITESNNCLFNNVINLLQTPSTSITPDATDVLSDPLFVDAANGDYNLKQNSPCVGVGIKWWNLDPRPESLSGEPLPDDKIDLGAYQSTWDANHPVNL